MDNANSATLVSILKTLVPLAALLVDVVAKRMPLELVALSVLLVLSLLMMDLVSCAPPTSSVTLLVHASAILVVLVLRSLVTFLLSLSVWNVFLDSSLLTMVLVNVALLVSSLPMLLPPSATSVLVVMRPWRMEPVVRSANLVSSLPMWVTANVVP